MPIYAYRCSACGHAKEVLQKMSDPLLSVCPACGESSFVKQVTAAGFQLKGSGWYVTDFRGDKKAAAPAADAAADPAKADAAKADPPKGDPAKADAAKAPAPASSESSGASKREAAPAPAPATAAPAPSAGTPK